MKKERPRKEHKNKPRKPLPADPIEVRIKATYKPYTFKPEYCQMLIDHMSEGLSINSFAGVIGVARCTMYEWRDAFPEFRAAFEEGSVKSELFHEKVGRNGMIGKISGFNAAVYCFTMKNRFGYRDNPNDDKAKESVADIEDLIAKINKE